MASASRNSFTLVSEVRTVMTVPMFKKLTLNRQHFTKDFCTEFHENLVKGLTAGTKSQTDGRTVVVPHKAFSFLLRKERIVISVYFEVYEAHRCTVVACCGCLSQQVERMYCLQGTLRV